MKSQLVAIWVQCDGPSIFGAGSGSAVQLFSGGTWRQLAWTPNGWQPLEGRNDAGTWRLLPPPAAVGASFRATVRFVAVSPSAASSAAPQQWTVRAMETEGTPKRAQFVEGSVVANYRAYVPAGVST